ncbi:glycosyl hydrolase [Thioclava pacifica]|nr:glycosyl hydrolase [Thioclava pacifica]
MLMPMQSNAARIGVGAWENASYTMINWIENAPAVSWYYNWRPDQMWSKSNAQRSVEFVPMIRDVGDVNAKIVSDTPVRTLLGFNEPDNADKSAGSAISVATAVKLWPKLEKRGLRLGSPATTQGQTLGANSWQRRFMDQVEARGMRVDFMAVHYYSTNGNVAEFKRWLQKVHAEYKRPIWVTEFAYVDWNRPSNVNYAQNAAFAEAAIEMMEGLPFVERHAWYAANPYQWNGRQPQINLVNDKLEPTPVGYAFDRTVSRIGRKRSQ